MKPRLAHPRRRALLVSLARTAAGALLVAAVALGGSSCSKKKSPAPAPPVTPEPVIGIGTPVTGAGVVLAGSDLAWSSLTNEICFTRRTDFATCAIAATGGAVRVVEGNSLNLTPSRDGKRLFHVFLGDESDQLILRELDLQNGQKITIGNPGIYYRLSLGDSLICYTALHVGGVADSLFLYHRPDSTKHFVALGVPLAFSPDGRTLFSRRLDDPVDQTVEIDLESGASSPKPLGLPTGATAYGPRWSDSGIRFVYRLDSPSRLIVRNVTTGVERTLLETTDSLGTTAPVWSHDNTKIAFITHRFVAASGGYARTASVWIVDAAAGAATVVARGTDYSTTEVFGLPVNRPEFSGNDLKLAYMIKDRVYTTDLP